MGNCNCLSSSTGYKNAETTVGQVFSDTKSTKPQNLQEKRGECIQSQSFVKQPPVESKIENFPSKKGSSLISEQLLIKECSTSRFKDRNEINIVIMGESNSGKSSFVIRYVTGKFESYHVVSVCNEYYNKKGVYFNGKKYDFNFIVYAGKTEYQEDIFKTCQDVDFFLMFYDVSSKRSFNNLKAAYNDIRTYMFNFKDSNSNVIFIGNKSDIKEKWVTIDEVKTFLQNDKVSVFETSVKNNTNITKVFNQILENFDKAAAPLCEK